MQHHSSAPPAPRILAMVTLTLRLFGALSLEFLGNEPPRRIALPRRSACLLALLALSGGRRMHRSELIDELWRDEARGGNAASLNTALWRLRKALAPFTASHRELLVSDSQGGLSLAVGEHFRVDALAFQQLTASGLAADAAELSEAQRRDLADAVALYRGELLVDVAEDWARRERERLRRRFIDTLVMLMNHAFAKGNIDEAIRRARHVLEIDPLREDIHRELMGGLLLRGQRAHALQQFEHCRNSLREEMAIAPMPETMALYRDVAAKSIHVREPAPGTTVVVARTRDEAAQSLLEAREMLAEAERQLQLFVD